jgi:transposase
VNSSGQKQFWHRDYNAALNILSCYLAVAQGVGRPSAFDRSVDHRASA